MVVVLLGDEVRGADHEVCVRTLGFPVIRLSISGPFGALG